MPVLLSPFVTYLCIIGSPCIRAALKHVLIAGASKSWKGNQPFFQGPWAPHSGVRARLHAARCRACPRTVHSRCRCPAAAHGLTQPPGRRAEACALLGSLPVPSPFLASSCHLLSACPLSPPSTVPSVMRPFLSPTQKVFACLFVCSFLRFALGARPSAGCWDVTEYEAAVVSACLTPAVWWGRETSKQEFTAQAGEGRQRWGPESPGQGTHLVHWVKGGIPEEVMPQPGPQG